MSSISAKLVRSLALLVPLLLALPPGAGSAASNGPRFPNVLFVSVDTLRTDHMSGFGYHRPTTPELDRLLARGTSFRQARTVEPLTGPALASLVTSLFPHEHGASRNGLRVRPGLASLPKLLARRGYRTGAFVGNWTLRDELTGLAEHFDDYEAVFSRKRWLGLFTSEATGEDLTAEAVGWIKAHGQKGARPYFLWVHYVEPHAPYRLQAEFADRLGVPLARDTKSDRYDTEIAFVDREIGRLLRTVAGEGDRDGIPDDTLVVFFADHGESLGEHGYWGHGRHLFESSLRIPLGVIWPGRVAAARIEDPALIIDIAPTVMGLLGLTPPEAFRGFDWSRVMQGNGRPPQRVGYFQAHKGAVHGDHTSEAARLDGLLEVAKLAGDHKQVLSVRSRRLAEYDVAGDPRELRDLAGGEQTVPPDLAIWLDAVLAGLRAASDIPASEIDAAARERLRALGYLD